MKGMGKDMREYTLLTEAKFSKPQTPAQQVALPHTWNALDGQDGGGDYFRGKCKYEICLPSPTKGKRQFIEFQAANHVASVCCNGVALGIHKGGFSTFRFELTNAMKFENNVLTVEVSNAVCDVYPQQADFTFFGGLYRKVYFLELNDAHFDLMKDGTQGVFVTPQVSGRTRVDVFTVNAQGYNVQIELMDEENTVIAEAVISAEDHCVAELQVESPHLWQGMEDPYCYKAKVSLIKDTEVLDQVAVTYGYRSYHIDPERGFFLNGKSVPLHGVCRHQDRQDMGWAISEQEHIEDIEMIREVGANTIRLAHYQHDQFFYDLCDKKGFAIWAEIPYISCHIHGTDAYENTMSQMKELIAQNYNHPSIIVWGIGNEITIGGICEEQYRNLCDLNALCKCLDPSRLTAIAQLASVPLNSPHNSISDVVSYNNYYGWYDGYMEDNGAHMDAFHAAFPDKPYGISEYGVDNMICWHSANPFSHDYTEEYACLYHHHMLKEFAQRPYLWATHMWNMFDFAVDQRNEGGVKGRNCKGLVTYDRKIKKDAYYIYQAYWSEKPMVHICGSRFKDRAPDERSITVFTNAKSVKLFVNDILYAEKTVVDCCVVFKNVPFAEGANCLKAIADNVDDVVYLNGVSEHNSAYDLPDLAIAIQAGNWFLSEKADIDYGEAGYNTTILMGDLCSNEECVKVIKGWIMTNPRMSLGEKLHTIGRLSIWRTSPASQKVVREIKMFKKYCVEEEFKALDQKLRRVKRV